jgi:hypothetical protein
VRLTMEYVGREFHWGFTRQSRILIGVSLNHGWVSVTRSRDVRPSPRSPLRQESLNLTRLRTHIMMSNCFLLPLASTATSSPLSTLIVTLSQ